jgi:hypothetical protein
MQRPAVLSLVQRVSRRTLALGLLALLSLIVGYVGQGSWGVGVATPSAVGAIVTDVVGGAGSRKPVRATVSLAVTNVGTDQIRVLGPASNGSGTNVLTLTPPDLVVGPRVIGRVDADVELDCDQPAPLRMPDLRLEFHDGARRALSVGGSAMLLEACSRAAPSARPLVAVIEPQPATTGTPPTSDARLAVRLSSPTGRRLEILAIRAGGVTLPISTPVTIPGKVSAVVRLTTPKTCPMQWQVAGIPSALTVDVNQEPPQGSGRTASSVAESGATLRLRLGPNLTSWLLDTSCAAAS